ncbi:efflux RND transporter periplasmic adaptor subunit [Chloroflexota bacterium]
MRSWRVLGIVVLCLVLIGSTACVGGDGEGSSRQSAEVVRGDLAVTVGGSGNVEALRERKLTFGTGGKIETIYVLDGDKVSPGDVLAKLDTSALELALTQAKVGLVQAGVARDEAEYNLNQLKDVIHASYDRIRIAEAALNAAEEQVKAAEQAVAQSQKQLDEASITAPFAGIAAGIDVDEGDVVSAAMTIVHLIDSTRMELKAEVDEIDIPLVELGQRAIIDVDALPDAELEGEVTSISQLPKTQAGIQVYEVAIELDIPSGLALKVGMSATADIVIDERSDVLLIPNRMVEEDSQGNTTVNVLVDEKTEERPVVTGISDGLRTEIISGLTEGETVVTGTD